MIGEELPVEREEDNQHDQHAVAVVKNGDIVGHMPRSISGVSCFFSWNTWRKGCGTGRVVRGLITRP